LNISLAEVMSSLDRGEKVLVLRSQGGNRLTQTVCILFLLFCVPRVNEDQVLKRLPRRYTSVSAHFMAFMVTFCGFRLYNSPNPAV
jgi:hypothetical protein